MRVQVLLLAVAIVFAGCAGNESKPSVTPSPEPSVEATPQDSPQPSHGFRPSPDQPLTRRPTKLTRGLARVTRSLASSVDDWIESGTRKGRPPRVVVLQALFHQRIHRLLVRNRDLAQRVYERLGPRLRRITRLNVRAGRWLRSLVDPIDPETEIKTGRAEPAGRLLRYYERAEDRFDVDREVLAAINMVETRFNRVRSSSSAGAQGPMQFLPSTWDAYGLGGEINDPRDAVMGAANYLRASGAPTDYRKALGAYNHADEYVDAVLIYARRMRAHDRNYFVYYNWQAFAVTTAGDKQLTGPGR